MAPNTDCYRVGAVPSLNPKLRGLALPRKPTRRR